MTMKSSELAAIVERHRKAVTDDGTCIFDSHIIRKDIPALLAYVHDLECQLEISAEKHKSFYDASVKKGLEDGSKLRQLELQVSELQNDLAHWKDCHGTTADKLEESNRRYAALREAALNLSEIDQMYRNTARDPMALVDAWVKLNRALRPAKTEHAENKEGEHRCDGWTSSQGGPAAGPVGDE